MKLDINITARQIILDMEGALILTPQDPKRGAEYTAAFDAFMKELNISFTMVNADIAQKPTSKIIVNSHKNFKK